MELLLKVEAITAQVFVYCTSTVSDFGHNHGEGLKVVADMIR